MTGFSDADLIARVLAHDDRNAFDQLVRRYQSDVRSLLRKMTGGDGAVADDIAQQTFIKAYRRLRSFEGGSKFSTWLYRIAYNAYVSSTRARRAETYGNIEDVAPPVEPSFDSRALARVDIRRAMAGLSAQEKMALALFYGHQYRHEEIAATMGVPLGTVKTHINRGREKMRRVLGAAEMAGTT